ncbi:MAG: AAA family ATPase [Acidobacteriota bacterium]
MSNLRDDDKPRFASGDQDYDSARGWDPVRENAERLRAEAMKKNPRDFAPAPAMLWVQKAQYYIGSALEEGSIGQLFGPLWLRDETAILFAPSGIGKSSLATQIAESIARGVPLAPFTDIPAQKVPPMRVLYLDFELTRWQFTQRYTVQCENGIDYESPYQFSSELLRAELYWNGKLIDGYDGYTDMLFEDILNRINASCADVLIVDNVTFLTRGSTANATIAFRLMDRLRDLKRGSDISVLVVAHTPKRRRASLMTENDMQGSIDLSKVADSIFAVGRSREGVDLRYVKHIKCRTGQINYGVDNVAIFKLRKFDFAKSLNPESTSAGAENFLGFEFVGFGSEADHVEMDPGYSFRRVPKPQVDPNTRRRAKALSKSGMSSAKIAKELSVSKATAHRYVTKN